MYSSTMNDDRLGRVVLLVEESSAPQRDSHGFKIVSADDALVRIEKFLAGQAAFVPRR